MDLNDLKPKTEDITVNLIHPGSGEPLVNDDKEKSNMTITVMSPNSAEYKKILHAQTNKRLKAMQGRRKKDITAEELEASGLDLIVATTKAWNITLGGEKPEFNANKVREVYKTYSWIGSQIDEAVEDNEAFT
jgi:hypothetical protein|tara:strand:- start:609 stop:1007 length:399 start_codon:yes stop_codon:yes gene_type:complete